MFVVRDFKRKIVVGNYTWFFGWTLKWNWWLDKYYPQCHVIVEIEHVN